MPHFGFIPMNYMSRQPELKKQVNSGKISIKLMNNSNRIKKMSYILIIKSVKPLFLIAILFMSTSCTNTYVGRYIVWNFSGYEGYKKFPKQTVENGMDKFLFKKGPEIALSTLRVKGSQLPFHSNVEELLKQNKTTSLVIIKDKTIIFEKYYRNMTRDSIQPAFSVTKSVLSLLIGIAIDEKKINSVDDLIVDYLPELKKNNIAPVTIKHLLTMSSGLKHSNSLGFLPWSTDVRVGYSTNIQKLVLKLKSKKKPGNVFLYHNQVPVLLAMILKRATGKSISQYTEEKLWKAMGMEYPAFWILDSKKSKFEKTDGGFNARSIDYAKLGQLVLNEGLWNGKQIISKSWIKQSTSPDLAQHHLMNLYKVKGFYYKYLWWGIAEKASYTAIAIGRYGQFIFIFPDLDMVIVRTGMGRGRLAYSQWYELIIKLARQIAVNLQD